MNAPAPAPVRQRSAVEALLDDFAADLADIKPEWAAMVVLSHWLSLSQDAISRLRRLGPAGDAAIPQVDTLLRRALNAKFGGAWRCS